MIQTRQHTDNLLIFHGIGTPGRRLEPGENRYWITRSAFCYYLDRILDMGPAGPEITFDDGNASDIDIALPELNARGLTATFFVLTARLGQPGALSSPDIATLAHSGQTIGLHGHSHRDWRRLDSAGQIAEFQTARQTLQSLAGTNIDKAAAPFGYYNRSVMARLIAEGFSALYTSDYGRTRPDAFIRPRNCIEAGLSETDISRILTGRVAPSRKPRRLVGIARKRLLPILRIQ